MMPCPTAINWLNQWHPIVANLSRSSCSNAPQAVLAACGAPSASFLQCAFTVQSDLHLSRFSLSTKDLYCFICFAWQNLFLICLCTALDVGAFSLLLSLELIESQSNRRFILMKINLGHAPIVLLIAQALRCRRHANIYIFSTTLVYGPAQNDERLTTYSISLFRVSFWSSPMSLSLLIRDWFHSSWYQFCQVIIGILTKRHDTCRSSSISVRFRNSIHLFFSSGCSYRL